MYKNIYFSNNFLVFRPKLGEQAEAFRKLTVPGSVDFVKLVPFVPVNILVNDPAGYSPARHSHVMFQVFFGGERFETIVANV